MHPSTPAAAEGKGTGDADGTHSIQAVRIPHTLSFDGFRRRQLSGEGNAGDNVNDLLNSIIFRSVLLLQP